MDNISKNNGPGGKRRVSLAEILTYQFDYDWHMLSKTECRDVLAEKDARDEVERAKAELSNLIEAAKSAAKSAEEAHQSEGRALKHELAASKSAETAKSARILESRTITWQDRQQIEEDLSGGLVLKLPPGLPR